MAKYTQVSTSCSTCQRQYDLGSRQVSVVRMENAGEVVIAVMSSCPNDGTVNYIEKADGAIIPSSGQTIVEILLDEGAKDLRDQKVVCAGPVSAT